MAKKISKHSRAARRGLTEEGSHESKELENIPKEENSDVRKSIIRTTIKNENLLAKKMENQKIKKGNKKKTNSLKHKLERNDKLSGVLTHKIQQSIDRAKYVQNARKSGWDRINSSIEIKNHNTEEPTPEKTVAQVEQEEEDAYVDEMFGRESKPKSSTPMNRFALLEEEVDA